MEWVEEEHEELVSALPAVTKERGVAYVIEDAHFDDFPIYESANAWWIKDRGKVTKLIEAFKMGHSVETACFYAGISRDKWRYFNEVHPNFSLLIKDIEAHPLFIKALNSVVNALDNDPKLAMSLLRARHPKFKKADEVEPPTTVVQQTVQVAVSQNVDTAKIEELLTHEARHFVSNGRTESVIDEGGGQSVEENS